MNLSFAKTHWRKFVLVLLLSYFNALEARQPVITIRDASEVNLIGLQTSYLEDPSGELEIRDVLKLEYQRAFLRQENEVFNRPATRSAFWYKFTLSNATKEDLWLEVGSTYAWYIDFYAPDSTSSYVEVIKTGTMRPDESKLHDVNLFWLPLNKKEELTPKTYYVRISSGLTYELPLQIGSVSSLIKHKDFNDYLTAGFIGLVLIMFLYNLFIYLSTRDTIYLFYLGYLLLMGISMPYANNYPFIQNLDFWFFNKEWWNEKFLFWHCPVYFFIGEFCVRYLQLKENGPLIRKVIYGELFLLSILVPILTLFGVAFVDLVNLTQALIVIFYLTCLLTGYYYALKKEKRAVYYVLGWTFLVSGAIVFFAVINGFLPFTPMTRNGLYFGVALEVWMFSLALGDRLNILQKEKDAVQKKNIQLMQEQNQMLETKVMERTEELSMMNEELKLSNEQLIEITDELNVQSVQLKEMNKAKDQIFAILGHDLRSPILNLKGLLFLLKDESISVEQFRENALRIQCDVEHLHFTLDNLLQWAISQMEGIKPNPELSDMQSQIRETTALLEDYINTKKITVKHSVQSDTAVYADPEINKLILRNLVYNAIKYSPEGGEININCAASNGKCQGTVADNGIGIPKDKLQQLFKKNTVNSSMGTKGEKGTGLGLMLCHEFAQKNGGELWAESVEGEGSSFHFTVPRY